MSTLRKTPQLDKDNNNNNNNNNIPSTAGSQSNKVIINFTNRRAKQILIYNQTSLNSLLNENKIQKKNIVSFEPIKNCLPNDSILVKKPFKHSTYHMKNTNNKNIVKQSDEIKPKNTNPSIDLLFRTAQVVNKFADYFEKNQNVSFVNKRNSLKRPLYYSRYGGLKPLTIVAQTSGPTINNCIGIINEPKNQNLSNLKEIYEQKLKLLEQKKESERQSIDFEKFNKQKVFFGEKDFFSSSERFYF